MAVAYAELPTWGVSLVPDPRQGLGAYITAEQERRNYSENRLAQAAGITKTYLRTLKTLKGRTREDDEEETEPSVRILRQLAQAFARGSRNPEEEELIFSELMDAAGYLPRVQAPPTVREDRAERAAWERETTERLKRELLEAIQHQLMGTHEVSA